MNYIYSFYRRVFLSSSSHKSKSIFPSSCMSTNIGLASTYKIEFEVAKKELAVVRTLSPLFRSTSEAKCKAAVPFATATQYFAPVYLQSSASNSSIFGPVVRYGDFNTSITLFISSSSIVCFHKE